MVCGEALLTGKLKGRQDKCRRRLQLSLLYKMHLYIQPKFSGVVSNQ